MTEDQLSATRDALIAQCNAGPSPLACKFEPYLIDHMNRGQPEDDATLAKISADCLAFTLKNHAIAIAALKDELVNDPEKLYAGVKPEDIPALMVSDRIVTEQRQRAPSQMEMIKQAVAGYLGKDYVPPAPEFGTVTVEIKPPRISIWCGIPYCRNVPTVDNIVEALK